VFVHVSSLHLQVCLEYLQRYFTLVCFASYVKGAHFPPSSPSSLTFGEWLAGRPELRSILERLLRYNPAAALALNKSPDALAPSEPACPPFPPLWLIFCWLPLCGTAGPHAAAAERIVGKYAGSCGPMLPSHFLNQFFHFFPHFSSFLHSSHLAPPPI
jgi:hypothetical protein